MHTLTNLRLLSGDRRCAHVWIGAIHRFRWLVLLVTAFVATSASSEVQFRLSPTCPIANARVTITVIQGYGTPSLISVLAVQTNSDQIKIVISGATGSAGTPALSTLDIQLGALPEGAYHADLYMRVDDGAGHLGLEQFAGATGFTIAATPGPCEPWSITIADGGVQSAPRNSQFPKPLLLAVTDSLLRPVSNASVYVSRAHASGSLESANVTADGVFVSNVATTDVNGIATFVVAANNELGSYTYFAEVTNANVSRRAFAVFSNRPSLVGPPVEAVVEYFNGRHYFMTAEPEEMNALDKQLIKGWLRTGAIFLAYLPSIQSTPANSLPVCRFYGKPEAGLDSHFFSASAIECQAVVDQFSDAWLLETNDAFRARLPDPTVGACPDSTIPLYRAYNNRADANHRYSTSIALIAQMSNAGWIREGYGPDAVAMCVPI